MLVVGKLDRPSRPLRDVLILMERLGQMKAGFMSLTEAIDTTTPADRSRVRNSPSGGKDRRPPREAIPSTAGRDRKMVSKVDEIAADAAQLFKIHPATVSRLLAHSATTIFRKTEYAR